MPLCCGQPDAIRCGVGDTGPTAVRRPAAQCHPHLRRRHGLRRHRTVQHPLRRRPAAHPESRPHGGGGRTADQFLRGSGGVLCLSRGAPHRLVLQPGEHQRRAQPHRRLRPQPRRGDDSRSAQAAWLCDRHVRQMASGPQGAVPAAAPGLRRISRTALLERHVATASAAEELLSRPAVDGRRSGRRARPRSITADDDVHRARGALHRAQSRTAVLPLRRARHAPRAAVRVRADTRTRLAWDCTAM